MIFSNFSKRSGRHKTREMLVSQRTQLLNGLGGHLTGIDVIAAGGQTRPRTGRAD